MDNTATPIAKKSTDGSSLNTGTANTTPNTMSIAANSSAPPITPAIPAKRKRVLRACDECRKKKVKCDGGNPCTHCSVYNYRCTYNQTSNKKSRSVITQNKIASYELFISSIFPDLDLTYLSSIVETKSFNLFEVLPKYLIKNKVATVTNKEGPSIKKDGSTTKKSSSSSNNKKDNNRQILSLVNIDEFVSELNSSMKDHCTSIKKSVSKKVMVPEMKIKLKSPPPIIPASKMQKHNDDDTSSPEEDSMQQQQQQKQQQQQQKGHVPPLKIENNMNNSQVPPINIDGDGASIDSVTNSIKINLPELKETLHLVHVACDSALLFKFYNRSNLIKIVQDFYCNEDKNDMQLHNKKLALIYSFLSVGALLENNDNAYNYYNAAHSLIIKKLIDTIDVMHIQSLFCLIIFLQCTCNLSKCYSYLGIALRSAFKMGLHRKVENINPILQENRKRIFWSIYKFDVYMNTILGLPQIFDDQIDQDLPLDIEDDNITETSYIMSSNNSTTKKLTTVAVSNYHTKLILILNHIVKEIYPINTDSYYDSSNSNFIVTLIGKVKVMENQLNDWLKNLPIELDPDNTNIPNRFYKPNRLLKLAYLHISLALYRPFIHLISYKYVQAPNINKDSIKYGMNCINMAIKIIELATELNDHQLLNGAYWFSIYPIFYSVACLVYYIHENSTPSDLSVNVISIRKFAEMGKDILMNLRNNSLAAAKTYQTLNIMFEQLNRRTKKFHTNHQKYFEDDVKQQYPKSVNNNNTNNNNNNNTNNNNNLSEHNTNQMMGMNNQQQPQSIHHHNMNSYNGSFSSSSTNLVNMTDNKSNGASDNVNNSPMMASTASGLVSIPEYGMENVSKNGATTNTTTSSVTTNTPTPPSYTNNSNTNGQERPPYHIDLSYNGNLQPQMWSQNNDNNNLAGQATNIDTSMNGGGGIPVSAVSVNNATSVMNNFDTPLSTPPITDTQVYHGSMIDKFDMNLFGRFLPPYMLQSKSNNFNFTQRMAKDEIGLNNVLNNDDFFSNVLTQDISDNSSNENATKGNMNYNMGGSANGSGSSITMNTDTNNGSSGLPIVSDSVMSNNNTNNINTNTSSNITATNNPTSANPPITNIAPTAGNGKSFKRSGGKGKRNSSKKVQRK